VGAPVHSTTGGTEVRPSVHVPRADLHPGWDVGLKRPSLGSAHVR